MLVSHRQQWEVRRPLHVGWARYYLLSADHHTRRLGARLRPAARTAAGAAAELRWAARLTAASAAARLERSRPRPWSDGRLLAVLVLTAVGAVAVAAVLGVALAEWMATRPGDVLPAAGGAVVVGAALCALMFLVFASRDRGREENT
jgi:hypothetical protein